MPTQWNRQDLALCIKDALEYAIQNLDDLPDEMHKNIEPFSGMQLNHDTYHSNVIYMRLDDGSGYRITLIQTQPPMPAVVHSSEREMAGVAGGEAGSGRRRRRGQGQDTAASGNAGE